MDRERVDLGVKGREGRGGKEREVSRALVRPPQMSPQERLAVEA